MQTSYSAFINPGILFLPTPLTSSFTPLKSSSSRTTAPAPRPLAFHNPIPTTIQNSTSGNKKNNNDKEGDPSSTPHEIPQSSVDWNQEWTRFKDSGMETRAGQGKTAEKKQIRVAKRKAKELKAQMQNSVQRFKMPSWRKLRSDWRFWIAVLIAFSVITSLASRHPVAVQPGMAPYM